MADQAKFEETAEDPAMSEGAGMLLLAHIAEVVEAARATSPGKGKKRARQEQGPEATGLVEDTVKNQDAGANALVEDTVKNQDAGANAASQSKKNKPNEAEMALFAFLTPSDLRLSPQALIETKVSHFRCNVNGCQRDYRSHTALAKHRREKHLDWAVHRSHGPGEDCALRAECNDLHRDCDGKKPHCHGDAQWPPGGNSLFKCPAPSCKHSAGQVQSLRYHYLRTHGGQEKFTCTHCGRAFAMKTDLNRHKTSCKMGFTCECGKLLRTPEGLATHRRIFHRKASKGGAAGQDLRRAAADGEQEGQRAAREGAEARERPAQHPAGGHAEGHAHAHGHAEGHAHAHGHAEGHAHGHAEGHAHAHDHDHQHGHSHEHAEPLAAGRAAQSGRSEAAPGREDGGGSCSMEREEGCPKMMLNAFLVPSDLVICEERMGWCCQRSTSPEAPAGTEEDGQVHVCGFQQCGCRFGNLSALALHRRDAHKDWVADSSWVQELSLEDSRDLRDFRLFCSRYNKGCKESFTSMENLRAHVLSSHKDPSCPCPQQHSHSHSH